MMGDSYKLVRRIETSGVQVRFWASDTGGGDEQQTRCSTVRCRSIMKGVT